MNRRRLMLLSVACLIAGPALFAAEADAVLDGWFAAQQKLRTWSADFAQTRSLKALTQPLVATGHVDFAMPDNFRWEIGRPARTIAVSDGSSMFVIYPQIKRAENYPLGANAPKQWRDMLSLLQAGFPHNRKEFAAQFTVRSLTETNGTWQLSLVPQSDFARQMMPELRLGLATNDYSLLSTEMIFVDGSRMRSDYTNAVINPTLDETRFHWSPPADFKVAKPLSK
jgi:outer membrane lipoprotein carrier protein